MTQPKKKYIVWESNGEGYTPKEFDTLEEAIVATKYTDDWYLTEAINHISAHADFFKEEEELK